MADDDHKYTSYEKLEQDYLSGALSADTVKQMVMNCLNTRMDVVRGVFESPELIALTQQAYPNEDMDEFEKGNPSISLACQRDI